MTGTTLFVAVGALCLSTGCGTANGFADVTTGSVRLSTLQSPGDVSAIAVDVTACAPTGLYDASLTRQADQSWTGTLVDVPESQGCVITAHAFDAGGTLSFSGAASNVRIYAGSLTDVTIVLHPVDVASERGLNTPPIVVALTRPLSIASSATATFSVVANDPDENTQLTYTWSVLSGGGTFDAPSVSGQTPGDTVTVIFTPGPAYVGFAVIQIVVSDGSHSSATTFPLAIE